MGIRAGMPKVPTHLPLQLLVQPGCPYSWQPPDDSKAMIPTWAENWKSAPKLAGRTDRQDHLWHEPRIRPDAQKTGDRDHNADGKIYPHELATSNKATTYWIWQKTQPKWLRFFVRSNRTHWAIYHFASRLNSAPQGRRLLDSHVSNDTPTTLHRDLIMSDGTMIFCTDAMRDGISG